MTLLASSGGLCHAGHMITIKIVVGFVSAAGLVGGLLVATPASAAQPDSQTQSARSVEGSARKAAGRVPGGKCKKKGKIVSTDMYGTLKCKKKKKGKKLVWKQIAAPGAEPGSPPGAGPGVPPGAASCATGAACVIGDTGPGGGKVFYVAGGPGKYLEAAPAGWASGGGAIRLDPTIVWCNNAATDIPFTLEAVGTGSENTTRILAGCASGAAVSARAYGGGGKTDWFLPSKGELNQMLNHKTKVGGLGLGFYWSSSQGNQTHAWEQNFSNGKQFVNPKGDRKAVRPVRAF